MAISPAANPPYKSLASVWSAFRATRVSVREVLAYE